MRAITGWVALDVQFHSQSHRKFSLQTSERFCQHLTAFKRYVGPQASWAVRHRRRSRWRQSWGKALSSCLSHEDATQGSARHSAKCYLSAAGQALEQLAPCLSLHPTRLALILAHNMIFWVRSVVIFTAGVVKTSEDRRLPICKNWYQTRGDREADAAETNSRFSHRDKGQRSLCQPSVSETGLKM